MGGLVKPEEVYSTLIMSSSQHFSDLHEPP